MPQPIVPGGVTSYVSCLLRGGVNIRQGGDCCSMWLILSERHMEKKKRANARAKAFAIQVCIFIVVGE